MDQDAELLTTADVAKLLQVSTQTIRRYRLAGKLEPRFELANGFLYARSDVVKLSEHSQ